MKSLRISLLAATLALLASIAVAVEPRKTPAPGPKERCPVCGMFVAMDKDWIAAIVFKDGAAVFFDGPKDLFRYSLEPGKYTKGRKPSDVQSVYVTEYYSARLTRAEGLFYVVGSDVLGPMGRELVPVDGEAQAKTFLTDHKGKTILRFKDVTRDELAKLD